MAVEGLEKERDFYFGKLRDIEVMCQDEEKEDIKPPIIDKILEVLYATEVIKINNSYSNVEVIQIEITNDLLGE